MFSARTPASLAPNRLTRTLDRLRAEGRTWIDLTVSNPTRARLPYAEDEIVGALADARVLRYEPSPFGPKETREAVEAYHARRGHDAPADRVALSASTSEAYAWLFKLLCEPGDCVLTPAPSYPLFECLAALESVEVRQYPLLEETRWGIDFAALDEAASGRARALVFVNPNNPTGTFLRPGEWGRLQEWCASRGLAVIVDEVFLDYAWDGGAFSSLAGPHAALTFTLNGLSKSAGLPQMKLGWTVVNGPDGARREAMERLEWIADSYLSVSAPVALAAPRWMASAGELQEAIRERCRRNLEVLGGALSAESGCRTMPAEGGWVAAIDVPRIHGEEEWTLRLVEEYGVLAQPGFFYDYPREAILVVSLLAPEAEFAEGVGRLNECFRSV